MYPLRYCTGEIVNIGDTIVWIAKDGRLHHGTITQLPKQASTTQWGIEEDHVARSQFDGRIMVLGACREGSSSKLILSTNQRENISWDKITLEKRSKALAYYITGEEVHQGDYVASNGHHGKWAIYRLRVLHVKSVVEYWEPGEVTFMELLNDQGEVVILFPYMNDDDVMSWSWEEVVFIARGTWPIENMPQSTCLAKY